VKTFFRIITKSQIWLLTYLDIAKA